MTIEVQKFKKCTIINEDGDYQILWNRGKELMRFPISPELVKKVSESEENALEVMFYVENNRWPEDGELDSYNKSNTIIHAGDGFTIYETNGKYEIGFFKEIGGVLGPEVRFPITKELMEKAFQSSQGAYEVMIYAETGNWPLSNQDEIDKEYIRENPYAVLFSVFEKRRLFTDKEFTQIVTQAITSELKPSTLDSVGVVDGHLELLLVDTVGWQEEIETTHLEMLQEKINNYIYYIESKQYAASYGDDFEKKVIHLTFQYHPSTNGLAFLDAVQKILAPTDMSLKIEIPM